MSRRRVPWSVTAAVSVVCSAALAQDAVTPGADSEDQQDAAALEARGVDYWNGRGVPQDASKSAEFFERAAAADRPVAQLLLANQLRYGIGVPADPPRAHELYRAAAVHGLAPAQAYLGWTYLGGGGFPRDFAEAQKWLRAAASQGDANALFFLSRMYFSGDGVDRDLDLYRALNTRSAELGNPPALLETAARLLNEPEHRDLARGMHLLEKGAEAGVREAKLALGLEYLQGLAVTRDYDGAARWLEQAWEKKSAAAGFVLGHMYAHGLGRVPDPARAEALHTQALEIATPNEKNTFAWTLATTVDPEFRDGAKAVAVMEAMLSDAKLRTPAYLDTLAAAYAENDQFDRAVETQKQAMAVLPATAKPTIEAFRARLEQYERREPYREQR